MRPDHQLARSRQQMDTSSKSLASGVASAVRQGQLPFPITTERAFGSHVIDLDGNEYIDYILGYGPNLFGYTPTPILSAISRSLECGINYGLQNVNQGRLAEGLARVVPCAEMASFSSTGSEAAHAAVRIARAATGRRKIIKFYGHYHGWIDPLAVSIPGSPPSPETTALAFTSGQTLDSDVLVCPWNDVDALSAMLDSHAGETAAVVMEPSACNSGILFPADGYLESVRRLCDDSGALLVFDEVITGFRVALGGAQERFAVVPDLCILGKTLGGGLPISAVAGREDVMSVVADGTVSHRGTFNGNALSVAAGVAALEWLEGDAAAIYERLEEMGVALKSGLEAAARDAGERVLISQLGSVLQLFFSSRDQVASYEEACDSDVSRAEMFAVGLLSRGVQVTPRGLWFLSIAHTDADIERTIAAAQETLASLPAAVSALR